MDDFKAAHDRHLEVEKDEVRFEFANFLQRFPAVCSLANDRDLRQQLQFLAQEAARDRLIVHDQSLDQASVHLCYFLRHSRYGFAVQNDERRISGRERPRFIDERIASRPLPDYAHPSGLVARW